MVDIFDYSRAAYFAPNGAGNRLYIKVMSRININWPSGKSREYWLVAMHPRENTFQNDGHIYDTMIALEQGASFITFMFDPAAGDGVISRRYDYPTAANAPHRHAFTGTHAGPIATPSNIPDAELRELMGLPDILDACAAMDPMFAVINYSFGGSGPSVRIESPVNVMNINPATRTGSVVEGKEWQLVTENVPVFVPGSDDVQSVRNGYAAFSRVGPSVQVSFCYLGNLSAPRATQDYALSQNYNCSAKLYARAA